MHELLSTEQVAEILGVSDRTVIRWRAERIGPPWCKIGRQVRYRRQSLNRWIAETEQTPVAGVA
ncbi:MAG: helix-turn-helix domain-containing protein [Pseudomonadota bacterium]|nr:MAG: helix-turn-helix domain-containing protein [Pseudomonadota bacterium]